ncbi:UDP-GlcNAc:undecaprenyl-phosphate GlcNAc-1-phosphate transferase [Silvibacterium bohemicum]|uniref:UDP-GlcNAc:undecaprenyl-phosphate GlcNAc-1-phosphate transferase n=1 Tax=Silvibacterium bohemicum TaxID=1577686 RepID=A0A841JR92_9BACT|nr:MraY family glycosyltransferase [Silvibacterium bohemicum]MBB6143670.1 UDP-GlcNAc:undecaprenyl-phosphate GlcNAc-1-phosphate transferase [Silvibacterium bohemicum]
MYTILGITAFVLCLILTPLCRDLALRFDIVDRPDSKRKLHETPIPRIGGVAIMLAYSIALVSVYLLTPPSQRIYIRHHELFLALAPATAIIFLTGLLDDLIDLKPWQKLAGQALGAVVAVGLGSRTSPHELSLAAHQSILASPWLNLPLSVVWLLGCSNAVNLIDGLDGLASGIGLLATLTTLVAGILSGNVGLVLATIPLAGCLLGFLRYNFHPASIYLGDCGSLTIGFLLGCFGLVWGQRSGTLLGMAAPMMALALPLIDVGLAICRRYLRRVPIFAGDRGHIHHIMLARGFRTKDTALILYGVCAIAASLALMQSFSGLYLHIPVIILFVFLTWIGVRSLNYIEFGAARRVFSKQHILGTLQEEIYLKDLDRSLAQARTIENSWVVVCKACKEMQIATVQMQIRNTNFETVIDSRGGPQQWKITVSLGEDGHLTLSRFGDGKPPKLMIPVLDRLQNALAAPAERE